VTSRPDRRTEHHLRLAFAGEGRDQLRFRYYAWLAEQAGAAEAAAVFRDIAEEELLHACRLFELAADTGIDPVTGHAIGSLAEVLASAVESERLEANEIYPSYARTARREGRQEVADWFERHAEADAAHAERLETLLRALDTPAR
jgi:rubrerythrin